MSFDFPNSPTEGTAFAPTGGPVYVYTGGVWRMQGSGQVVTAEARNRIVNGAMQISQENGDTALGTSGGYPADQWTFITAGFTPGMARFDAGLLTSSRKAIYMSNTVARPSPAAGDYCMVFQPIEGVRMADFGWGTASAKPIVVRFRALSTNAGTYSLLIRSPDSGRSYLAPLTMPAGGWNDYSFVVPGDTTGTWPTTTATGMIVAIGLATGTTYGGGVAGWQAGYKMQIAGNSNFCAAASVVFYLGDVGLYCDPNATGVPPPWQMPDEAEELRACMRYYQKTLGQQTYGMYYPGSLNAWWGVDYPVTMRVAPTLTAWGYTSSNGNVGYNLVSANSCRLDGGSITTGSAYATFGTIRAARM